MATLDRQWAFDTALAGLRAQGFKSYSEKDGCLYRGPDGSKCGVGFLIPDERYSRSLERKTATAIEVIEAVAGGALGYDDARFLDDLQSYLHDELDHDLTGLENGALDFASQYDLAYAAPEQVLS